jgi:ABC-type dipeptide/oligopeptide/nickel transport system permease component
LRDYIVKRLAQGLLLVFAVTVLTFSIMQMMPGDPIDLLAGDRVTAETKMELKEQWGLDKPAYVQYCYWIGNIAQGDFGTSIRSREKVTDMLKQRLGVTLTIVGISMILEFLIAVPLGLIAAYKRDSVLDKMIVSITTVLGAIPKFWAAIIFILIFSVKLNWLPMSGFSGPKYLILPVASIVLTALTEILRLTRSEVLEVYREKYIQTAYAKGLKNKIVLSKHVLRNALIPVCVMFFLYLPWLIGGEVIIENIFSIPGMGRMLWEGIVAHDYPVIQACILIIAILTVLSNIAGDIMTGFLDPRIRVEMKGEIK